MPTSRPWRAGTGNDTIYIDLSLPSGSYDLAGGNDTLIFSDFGGTVTAANVESILGKLGNDKVTLSTSGPAEIDLGDGNDTLILASGGNTVTMLNVETVTGGAGNDLIILGATYTGGTIDLGGGSDMLQINASGATVTVNGIESIAGGWGSDVITFSQAYTSGEIDLDDGDDKVSFANFANTATIINAETIVGGSQDDRIILRNGWTGGTVSLGLGNDYLSFTGGGTLSVSGARDGHRLCRHGRRDHHRLWCHHLARSRRRPRHSVMDRQYIGDGECLRRRVDLGWLGGRLHHLHAAITGAHINLGDGTDRLALYALDNNTLTVSGVESISGGISSDVIVINSATYAGYVNLDAGIDTIELPHPETQ